MNDAWVLVKMMKCAQSHRRQTRCRVSLEGGSVHDCNQDTCLAGRYMSTEDTLKQWIVRRPTLMSCSSASRRARYLQHKNIKGFGLQRVF